VEQPLTEGNVSTGVVRVGDTVRRPTGPWTGSVDALLRHLERVGFNGAPRALGRDEQGRQVIEYVPGQVNVPPSRLDLTRGGTCWCLLMPTTRSAITTWRRGT